MEVVSIAKYDRDGCKRNSTAIEFPAAEGEVRLHL